MESISQCLKPTRWRYQIDFSEYATANNRKKKVRGRYKRLFKIKNLRLLLFPESKAAINVFAYFFIAETGDVSSTVLQPLIRCGCLHNDPGHLSTFWEALLHHLSCLAGSISKELNLDVLEAVFPLSVPHFNVLHDGLVKVTHQFPRKAAHMVEHLEAQQVPHLALVHWQIQLQDVKVAQHEEIKGQLVVFYGHSIQTRQELLWGVESLLPVKSGRKHGGKAHTAAGHTLTEAFQYPVRGFSRFF